MNSGGGGEPSILQKLHELGYTEPEIVEIRALIEIFSHGNMPYLLIATAARLLLEGNEIGTARSISKPAQSHHGPAAGRSLVLMEPHHAERQLQELYEDLKSTLGLTFLEYRLSRAAPLAELLRCSLARAEAAYRRVHL